MAILKLRRGTSIPSLAESELFYHTSLDTLVVGDGTNSHILLKSGSNTVNLVDISGTISASYIHVSNDLTIHGNLYLGNQDTDNIVISAELSSSLIPDVDNTFDVGSSSKKWRHLYATSASIDELVVNGSGIVSSSQQISNYNTFLEIDGMGVFSGSSQVNADTITNFDTNVKDKMNDDGVISGSSQLTTEFDTRYLNTNGDSVISSSAQLTTEFDTRYLNTDGDSVISSSAQLTTEFDTRYLNTNGDGVISSSAQLDSVFLEIDGDSVFSSSQQVNANDITNFDSNVKDKMNADGVISGSTQLEGEFLQINGDSVVSSSAQISGYNTFLEINGDGVVSGSSQINTLFVGTAVSTSLDSRLDSLETDSHTHANKANLDTINQNLSTTDNVTFNTGSFTGNMTITGDLTVLGSSVEIQTSELRIEDKLITVASGSADSTAADGAGLEIDGANKSLTWDHNSTSFVFDAKVSSSVGFKGEGGELTGIDTDQVTEAGNLYYTNTRVLDYINDQGVISGSSQVNADSVTNFDSNVLSYINDLGVVSGSAQLENVFLEINGDSVVSSSQQVIDLLPTGVVSGSAQLTTEFDTRYLNTEGDSVVSGSSQIDVTATTNYGSINQYSDTKVKNKLNDEGVLSGSQQVVDSLPSGLVSGSSQITDGSGIVSSSAFSSPSQGTVRATINGTQTDVDTGLQSADSPSFAGLTLTGTSLAESTEYTALFLTSSDNSITRRELATAAFYNVSSSIDDGNPNVLGSAGAVKNYVDGKIIAAAAGDITAVLPVAGGGLAGGGYVGDVSMSIDTGSAHFTEGVTKGLPDGLVSQSSQLYSDLDSRYIQDLGEGAFSSSAQVDHDATNNFEANEHIDHTSVSITAGDGLSGGGDISSTRTLTLDTGSSHFLDGVKEKINLEGVFSSSAQVNADSITNFDSNVLAYINDLGVQSGSDVVDYTDSDTLAYINSIGVISGSEQVNANTITNFDTNVVDAINDENVHSGSYLGTATTTNLTEGTNLYYTNTRVTNQVNDLGLLSGSSQLTSSLDSRYLEINGDSVVSGSQQVVDLLQNQDVNFGTGDITATDITGSRLELEYGTENILVGKALATKLDNVSSIRNVAIGYNLLGELGSTGNQNVDNSVAIGVEALAKVITGGSSNVGIGYRALFDNTSGDNNTAIGVFAGSNIDIGDRNTTIGSNAGLDITSGMGNTTIGYLADVKNGTDFNSIVIGSGSVGNGSNTVVIGNDYITNTELKGEVTASGHLIPSQNETYDLGSSNRRWRDLYLSGSTIDLGGTLISKNSDGDIEFINSDSLAAQSAVISYTSLTNVPTLISSSAFSSPSQGTVRATINGSSTDIDTGLQSGDSPTFTNLTLTGNLTVQGTETILNTAELVVEDKLISVASGSTTSAEANGAGLHISGANESLTWDHANSRFNFSDDLHVVGQITATDDVVAYASSDERLKDNIQPIENPIEKINKISGNSFVWNEEKQNIYKGKDYGVIAQEIEKVLPELVQTRENGYKAVKYDKIVSLLIEGIKELSKEVTELKKNIRESN